MWSVVGSKAAPRWLWHALDHQSGTVLASVFGRRNARAFLALKARSAPCGMTRFDPEGGGVYQGHLDPPLPEVGKRNTRQLERTHRTRPTRIKRLARKTIGFAKSMQMHVIVVRLFIHRFAFGREV